jgi:hypothetical protein
MSVPLRLPGGLNKPARVTVDSQEWDGLRIELETLRHDVCATCDALEPRLRALEHAAIEIGPLAYQLVAACLHGLARLRRRASA